MRILHICTNDVAGGAARASYRLHQGLLRLECDSTMFVANAFSDNHRVSSFRPPMDKISRLRRRLRRELIYHYYIKYRNSRSQEYEIFSDDRTEYGATILRYLPPCDLINLHWVARFIDYSTFFPWASRRIPVVWRISDMNPFTGGCHYDLRCGKYNSGCGACPQLGSNEEKDLSSKIWNRKRRIFESLQPNDFHIVCLSSWMAHEVRNSALLHKFPVSIIPNGIDSKIFFPRGWSLSRDALEIPREVNVIVFVADSVINRRKGFRFLTEALNGLSDNKRPFLISVGRGKPSLDSHFPHFHLGHIENDRLLSLVYSAANLFVIPSIQDNFPNTVLESMACGTPVVGFNVGGIPDLVRPGVTGLLIPPEDVKGLRSAIDQLLSDARTLKTMSSNCRNVALEEFSSLLQAQRYLHLYQGILRK